MANLFVNLPLPVGNGPGTAVDVSGMGLEKSIICDGTFPHAVVAIEISVDGGTSYAPLPGGTFQTGTNKKVIPCAAQWMRVNVSGRSSAFTFSASVNVGGNDAGGLFAALPIPVGDGAGAAVNVAAFGSEATFIVAGTFPGAVVEIQASEDGTDYAPILSFAGQGGIANFSLTADFYRTFVKGRASNQPFSATAAVGAVNDAGGGGGGGGGNDIVLLNGNAGVLLAGAPVYSSANGTVDKAKADAVGTTEAIGLVAQDPSIAIGASGTIRTAGPLTLTTAQWDLITGDVGGLLFNQEYWVDPATAGKLTKTAPTTPTQFVKPMGRAVSTEIMIIDPEPSTGPL